MCVCRAFASGIFFFVFCFVALLSLDPPLRKPGGTSASRKRLSKHPHCWHALGGRLYFRIGPENNTSKISVRVRGAGGVPNNMAKYLASLWPKQASFMRTDFVTSAVSIGCVKCVEKNGFPAARPVSCRGVGNLEGRAKNVM